MFNTYRIHAYNGYIQPKRLVEDKSVDITAVTAADAVRDFARDHGFSNIGPNGLRVKMVYDMTNKKIVEDHEFVGILNTFEAKDGSGKIVTDGRVL